MPLRTTLCPTAATSRCPFKLHTPGGAVPNHELFIDLEGYMDRRPTILPPLPEDPEFLLSIRDVIVKSKQPGGTPIDAVHIAYCSGELPDYGIWEALEEAEPSHLELSTTDRHQRCNYGGLGKIKLGSWARSLKSVYLDACSGDGDWLEDEEDAMNPSFPACYAGVETLILDFGPSCDSLYFYPAGGATNLKSLRIIEGESVTIFARTVECNPRIADTLESLAISCTILESRTESVVRMKKFLKEEAKALQVIELIVEEPQFFGALRDREDSKDVFMLGLAKCLPDTLTALSFTGPSPGSMKDMDSWIESASSPSWLANLKKVGFKLTQPYWEKQISPKTKERTAELELEEKKVESFLNFMRQRQPPVEVIQPKSNSMLAYPLEL